MKDRAKSEPETWLVLRAQSGDRKALDKLLQTIQGPLYRYISTLIRERGLAEDILQEVFIRLYRKLRWLREPRVFRSWAYQIATRETFRYLKREQRWIDQVRDETILNSLPALPGRAEFAAELDEQLPQMIAKLSPASRAVIVLYYLEEMSFEETAAVLEIPVGTVKSRLAYGLEKLRRQLKTTIEGSSK